MVVVYVLAALIVVCLLILAIYAHFHQRLERIERMLDNPDGEMFDDAE